MKCEHLFWLLDIIVILKVSSSLDFGLVDFVATGVHGGLEITLNYIGPSEVTCLLEGSGDDELIILKVPQANPPPIQKSFLVAGYYDIYLSCYGPEDMDTTNILDFYVGDEIAGIQFPNASSELIVPVKAPLSSDVILEVYFENGTHVQINVTLLHSGEIVLKNDTTNGSNFVSLPYESFGVGMYTAEVRLSNPLSTEDIVKHVLLVVQAEVNVTEATIVDHKISADDITYVMTEKPLNITTSLATGQDVTFTLTILDKDDNILDLIGDTCVGEIPFHSML